MDPQAHDRDRRLVAHVVVVMLCPPIAKLREKMEGLQGEDHDVYSTRRLEKSLLKSVRTKNNIRRGYHRDDALALGNADLVILPTLRRMKVPAVPLGLSDA